MTEGKPQHDSEEVLNFQRFLSFVILIKRILIKKPCKQILSIFKYIKHIHLILSVFLVHSSLT